MPNLKRLKMHMKQRAILLAKMYLDRRPLRGAADHAFRWCSGDTSHYAIQATSRRTGRSSEVRLRRGTTDLFTFEQVFCNNDYCLERLARWLEIVTHYEKLVSTGSTPLILDLGANVGMASVNFALNWPEAKIVALEPSPGNFAALRRNVQHLPNIEAMHAAVAGRDGTVRIADPNDAEWAIRTELASPDAGGGIPAHSIPTLLARATEADAMTQPFLCKIDIEGFESDLFQADTAWISRFPVIVVELHDWMMPKLATSRSFLQAISRHDRDFVYIGENVFSIANDF